MLFTGDTLFVGRTGRTIDKKSDTRDLYKSVYNKILTLPDKITISGNEQISKQVTEEKLNEFQLTMKEDNTTIILQPITTMKRFYIAVVFQKVNYLVLKIFQIYYFKEIMY